MVVVMVGWICKLWFLLHSKSRGLDKKNFTWFHVKTVIMYASNFVKIPDGGYKSLKKKKEDWYLMTWGFLKQQQQQKKNLVTFSSISSTFTLILYLKKINFEILRTWHHVVISEIMTSLFFYRLRNVKL